MAEIILQCILGVLAVFGGYCLIKLICTGIFTPEFLSSAVIISEAEQAEVLSEMIEDAMNASFFGGNQKMSVFFAASLFDLELVGRDGELYEKYSAVVKSYGLDWKIYKDY